MDSLDHFINLNDMGARRGRVTLGLLSQFHASNKVEHGKRR